MHRYTDIPIAMGRSLSGPAWQYPIGILCFNPPGWITSVTLPPKRLELSLPMQVPVQDLESTILKKLWLALLLMACCLPCEAKHMAVVVNKSNLTANVSAPDLTKIFQANTRKWADGKSITIVLRDPSSPETQEALQRIFKMTQSELVAFLESHKGGFITVDSDQALLKVVETTPGALGLVDVYSITSKVNVVKVDGKLPLEQGYLLH